MNEPKVIYLNIGFDKIDGDIETIDFNDLVGISWCDTKINDQDIRYELVDYERYFSFANYVNGRYEFFDSTEKDIIYEDVFSKERLTEKQIFEDWIKHN